ncbi:arsenic transporter [Sphingobium sp.]|uniref:arsenic transporter n=1 Tax=Sphingobium sp. TaxID=1912891 RepID=UPI003BB7C2FC
MIQPSATLAIGAICAATTTGILIRPFRLPEAVWATTGALLVVLLGLLPPTAAIHAVGEGGDVYLFLIGMMLLSEAARVHGLFDWTAAWAVRHAHGSPTRLFALVFAVGVVVTTFLSNDATAVVLTPAVYAAARRGRVDPLPLLFACAFVANAASFVLPISNPANLVLYGGHMPPLGEWLRSFAAPSAVAIGLTYTMLRFVQRTQLKGACATDIALPELTSAARFALGGIVVTAILLLTASARDWQLGWPTCIAGIATAIVVQASARQTPLPLLKHISWSVLPLVAGLFVLVEALASTGMIAAIAQWIAISTQTAPLATAASAGGAIALLSNVVNNLPAGLVAAQTLSAAQPPRIVVDAVLIGVDIGPNLSITGSLATILWLSAIRREGEDVGFWRFLKVGSAVMIPATIGAIGCRLLIG